MFFFLLFHIIVKFSVFKREKVKIKIENLIRRRRRISWKEIFLITKRMQKIIK